MNTDVIDTVDFMACHDRHLSSDVYGFFPDDFDRDLVRDGEHEIIQQEYDRPESTACVEAFEAMISQHRLGQYMGIRVSFESAKVEPTEPEMDQEELVELIESKSLFTWLVKLAYNQSHATDDTIEIKTVKDVERIFKCSEHLIRAARLHIRSVKDAGNEQERDMLIQCRDLALKKHIMLTLNKQGL